MPIKPELTAQSMLQAAERYLEQTEVYEAVTLKAFAEFLGLRVHIVYRRLPQPQWEQLRRTWIQSRLRKTIEDFCSESKTQEDFTAENIARSAKMPPTIVRRFLPEDEWQAYRAALPTIHATQRKVASREQPSVSAQYILQAERYVESVQRYEELTMVRFAEFLGVPKHIIHTRFPSYQWEILRNRWIEEHLKCAMEAAYAEAKTQDDFTVKDIARHAEMPYMTVQRFLSEDEWKARQVTLPGRKESLDTTSQFVSQAEAFFAQITCYEDATIRSFAHFLGVTKQTVSKRLPPQTWKTLKSQWMEKCLERAVEEAYAQNNIMLTSIAGSAGMSPKTVSDLLSAKEKWRPVLDACSQAKDEAFSQARNDLLSRIMQAMDKVYAEAKTQEDFTLAKIASLANVSHEMARSHVGKEWRTRKATLPTAKEKMLAALQSLVDANIPVSELTRKRVIEVADVNNAGTCPWFSQPLNEARRQLARRSHEQLISPPPGMNIHEIPGGWIDLDASVWDLRPAGEGVLLKEKLREDIADIAWPLLRDELRSPEIPVGTIDNHYRGFLKAGSILGGQVPDIRQATLEAVQDAWMSSNETQGTRAYTRNPLVMLFDSLTHLAERDKAIDSREMFRIAIWLQNDVTIGHSPLGDYFLSESELNSVIRACLDDIAAGVAYTNTNPDLLSVSLHPLARENAAAVVRWAVALVILIMIFTGLRRESVLAIKTSDWAKIHAKLYVLAWHHNKKVEENIAVLPAPLAQLLQIYVQRTTDVRAALKVDSLFLVSDSQGIWRVIPVSQFHPRLRKFVERHHLERDGIPLVLDSRVLRRTYATRALYEGRNLAAIRAQLGHVHLDSTLRYVKFDDYEHPAEIGASLDEYGRKALTLWHAPLILDELDQDERASLLGAKEKREQDVGLCRYNHCVKAIQGSPPPCSLCEHLVTGPEFFTNWNREHQHRKNELEVLAEEPGSEMMLAQKKYQFEQFEMNFAFLQEKFHV